MSVSIIVPLLEDGAERSRNWAFVRSRYEELFPDWEIVVGTCEEPWRKGIAVNRAVQKSDSEILVISDADVIVPAEALRDAVKRLEVHPWVVPHRMVYRLTEDATKALIDGRLRVPRRKEELERVRKGSAGGGVAVMERKGWETVHGMDERFEGWGGEDVSFGFALDTLVGPHYRMRFDMLHLYHQPLPMRPGINGSRGRGSDESEELANRYLQANGNSVQMRELIEEQHKGMLGGGIVVTSREVVSQVPLDPRFEGWGQEDESWGFALTALVGPPRKGTADLIHLHHPPPVRLTRARGNFEGWELRRRYHQARLKPNLMYDLIEEARGHLGLDEHDRHAG